MTVQFQPESLSNLVRIGKDGNTFYVTSAGTMTIVALDISDLGNPKITWAGIESSHGLSLDSNGDRAYVSSMDGPGGLVILDTSEIGNRRPNPKVTRIARLTWDSMSIPQNSIPVVISGEKYLIQFDEFASDGSGLNFVQSGIFGAPSKVIDLLAKPNGPNVGAARIIDLSNERKPRIVSNVRLEVHNIANRTEIAQYPGAQNFAGGYGAHYCSVPTTIEPKIMACSMLLSGLRVFDIRDPRNPKEVAYYLPPVKPRRLNLPAPASNWAMSKPAFDFERREIWYSDVYQGFFAVRLTNDVW